ncbi:MAG: LppX_LprAFG lipoprotein [Dehalococcoidia bacterium]|nr:LppX_LprAFG lipoprotein [Dehalococcoidia bacterium]
MLARVFGLAALAALAALVALGTAACGDGDGGEERDVSSVDAAAVLREAADRLEAAESFHVRVEHENGSTQIVSGLAMTFAEGDYAGPDRVRLEIQARAFGSNIASGVVILPDTQYLKNPITGRWMRQEIAIDQIFDPSSGITALMRGVTGAKAVSSTRIEGVTAYVIEAEIDSGDLVAFVPNAQPGAAVQARVWVGVEDSRPYRAELAGPVAAGDAEDVVRRVDLSAFDVPVQITAPPQ